MWRWCGKHSRKPKFTNYKKNNLKKKKEKMKIIAFPKEKNENLIIKISYVGHYSMWINKQELVKWC